MELKMVTELDKGIYQSDREAWSVPEIMEANRANLAYILDWRDYRLIETRGSFGSIGMGETNVYLVDDDDNEILVTDENEDDIWDSIATEGELSRDQLDGITGKVWDGNNHVFFVPGRSQKHCNEPDIEGYEWGSVKYGEEHAIENIEISEGWVLLGGLDCEGYWFDGQLSRKEFDELREDSMGLEFETFEDEENETVALFATKENYEKIRKFFDDRERTLRQIITEAVGKDVATDEYFQSLGYDDSTLDERPDAWAWIPEGKETKCKVYSLFSGGYHVSAAYGEYYTEQDDDIDALTDDDWNEL